MFLPRTVATAVDVIARQAFGKDWSLYAALLSHWSEIVGPDYARVTTPVKITFPKGKQPEDNHGRRTGGTLHIRLPSGLVMEFNFLTDQIRQRITGFFGYDAIIRIVFEPFYGAEKVKPVAAPKTADPAQLAALHEKAAMIEDEALREALEKLGKSVLEK